MVKVILAALLATSPAMAQDFYTYQQSAWIKPEMVFFLPDAAVILDAEARNGRATLHTVIPLSRVRWEPRYVCATFGNWKRIPDKAEYIARDGKVYFWEC